MSSNVEAASATTVSEPPASEVAMKGADDALTEPVAAVDATSKANALAVDASANLAPIDKVTNETDLGAEDITMTDRDLDTKAAETTTTAVSGTEVVAPDDESSTPAKKNNSKRRSSGIPEHKSKKLNKKKSMPVLNLDAHPGDYFWARLKGYPPWPSIICDEEMLPETLLATRPVTAMRTDGTYRTDFEKGGKNEKDRTYPVMYLHTNEFSWIPNTDLSRLDISELKEADSSKKGKQLISAYEVAKEGHDLQYFKDLLLEHEKSIQEEVERQAKIEEEKEAKKAAKEAAKEAKTPKKEKKKAKGSNEDVGDVQVDSTKTPKSSKKRKKDAESDTEAPKSAKTPKTNLKVSLSKKTPNGESASKPKQKKSAKASEPSKPKELTVAEKREKTSKEVLYFRHRLQKGFLATDHRPKEEEMKQMAEYFTALESHKDLESSIIRATKIHKVLKAIIKLSSIPKDEEFRFKERSITLLNVWQKALADDTQAAMSAKDDNTPNGDSKGDSTEKEKTDEPKESNADSSESKVKDEAATATEDKDDSEPNAADSTENEKVSALESKESSSNVESATEGNETSAEGVKTET